MWTSSKLFTQPFFIAAESKNRYVQIFRFVNFDDTETRKNLITDKLEAVRSFLTTSVKLVLKIIHQAVVLFWTKGWLLKGKTLIYGVQKNKPGRYGLKILVCADAEKSYVLKLQVYTGTVGGNREVRQGKRVVMDLVERYCGSWRGVTLDNPFHVISIG